MWSAVQTAISPLRYLRHPVALAIAAIVYFLLVRYFDTRWRFLPYALASTLVLATMLFLVSRRPVFALYGAALITMLLALASMVKFELKGIALHVYDFIVTGSDSSILSFLVTYYTSIVVAAAAVLALAIAFMALMFAAEKPLSLRLAWRVSGVGASIVMAVIAYQPTKRDADFLPFVAGYNASAFFLSLWHVPNLVQRHPLVRKLEQVPTAGRLADAVNCNPGNKRPDLFLVLSESQTAPSVLPQLSIPARDEESFRSADGQTRPLFVEIFGGGTWMTNFSVLTGLSTADLGWQGPYVNQLFEGRINGALPDVLARCGYRTVAIMPMRYHSVNEGPFLRSIGFEEVYDSAAMNVEVMGIRDTNYFEYAEKIVRQHRAEDTRPLFMLVQTMFPHSPYDKPLSAGMEVATHDYGAPGEVNEYMRRVAASRIDFRDFLERRKAEPGRDGSVVAEFGDHQSFVTRDYVLAQAKGDNPFTDFRSKLYETFYAVHGFGVDIDFAALNQPEDAPFLSARLLAAARLPTSPVFDDLLRLSEVCAGRYHTCEQRAQIDAHLKKRLDADLIMLE
jgi:hypothetical protein